MSDHSDWKDTKSKAKKANDNKSFKFPKDMKLGDKLDKLESAEKKFSKAGEKEHDKDWAKAGEAYFKAASEAQKAALVYHQALPGMHLTEAAHDVLDAELAVNLLRNLNKVIAEGKRMEPLLERARKR